MKKERFFNAFVSQQFGYEIYEYLKKSSYCFQTKFTKIVQVHLFTSDGNCILFDEGFGFIKPITGKIEEGESSMDTALREVAEEIGLVLDHIHMTLNYFSGISPKGKKILGRTCFAILPESFSPSAFKFNEEILGYISLSKADALSLLIQKGFPEAASGFRYILDQGY